MPSEHPAIELQGLTKTFGSIIANQDIDLTVYNGEILALLGENGSGKTTLMNMLSGIYKPDAGHIRVNGKEVHIRSPHDAIALGTQDSQLQVGGRAFRAGQHRAGHDRALCQPQTAYPGDQ